MAVQDSSSDGSATQFERWQFKTVQVVAVQDPLVWEGAQEVSELLVTNSGGEQFTAQHLPGRGAVIWVGRHQPPHHLCHLCKRVNFSSMSRQVLFPLLEDGQQLAVLVPLDS